MKRKMPTILILFVMVLIGAMYWVDLSYYTDYATGFLLAGSVWARYAVLLLPAVMAFLGMRTVGAGGISALRVKNYALAAAFGLAALSGGVYGIARLVAAVTELSVYSGIMGILCLGYAVWMGLCAVHFALQKEAAPTRSAVFGVAASLPFFMLAISRVMVRPTSLYRVAPFVASVSAIIAILWFSLFLRAAYVAMPQRLARLLYFAGVFLFLFGACLEFPGAVHRALFFDAGFAALAEGAAMGALGLVGGVLSVSIAGRAPDAPEEDLDPD